MGKMKLIDLSHPFGADIPLWPYFSKPVIDTMHGLAKSGVLSQKITVVMHSGTHADSPRHVMERDFAGKRARYTQGFRWMPMSATQSAWTSRWKTGVSSRPPICMMPANVRTSNLKNSKAWSLYSGPACT